jgi:hypothetical protein
MRTEMAKSSRSAGTGRFVTSGYANSHKSTAVTETRGAGSAGGTFRSAKTGRFVTDAYGKSHPGTTIKDN